MVQFECPRHWNPWQPWNKANFLISSIATGQCADTTKEFRTAIGATSRRFALSCVEDSCHPTFKWDMRVSYLGSFKMDHLHQIGMAFIFLILNYSWLFPNYLPPFCHSYREELLFLVTAGKGRKEGPRTEKEQREICSNRNELGVLTCN